MQLLDTLGINAALVNLDHTKHKDDVLDIDFKDRDGNWVLRFRDKQRKFWQTRLGKLHNNMTQRAKGNWNKFGDCYLGVTLSSGFADPQAFCHWAVEQAGWGMGYHLDKDLLSPQGGSYSESTCVFIPREINLAIARRRREASVAIRDIRIRRVLSLAERYKSVLDPRAYAALLEWEPVIRPAD